MTQHARPDGPTPLDGVLVADFSRVLAGPSAAMTLADLGATVVKVEHPEGGDDTRRWGPPWTEGGSSYFDAVNRTKRSIALDLRDPADLAVAHELVARADVLVENFRPRSLDGFGLAPAATLRMNPRLVHCSVTGFGAGAGADLPGYDLVVQAVGGLMSITGQADGDPQKVGVALVDVLTGKDAVIGILAALRHRDVTGLGQHVEVNLLQSLIGSLANQASAFLASGVAPTRLGNAHPSIAPYESLRCADGLLVVACGNDGQFGRLCDVLGLDDLRGDPRFATNGDRVAHRDELVRLLEDVLGQRPAAEWQALLSAASVPAGGVNDIAQGIELATSLGLDPVVEIDGTSPQVAHPIRYSAFTSTPPTAPPALGQHSSEIRRWLTTLHQEHA
ncbi:CaiB/BaiF CoA transferase family protein [Aeromicrobium fastidiosum]|uniref:CoA transferase n=1 Tax=Aeromicrobium fastidiosum TaxID=52699 RepID=A0A641APW9_9ACTN|nr:CoA transferase [Aeromicrobium fastidiosum]KAA1378142.1 CoA transferase [Aeromicrobium fastidiosum]MBP2389057.1 formyl-CoA transferase [Aeromicrobium fastidiosum]